MSNNKQTEKCIKCNKDFIKDIENKRKEAICSNCKKKKKIYVLALLCLVLVCGSIGMMYWFNGNQSKIVSFEGVGVINDSISLEVQETPVFKMEKVIARKSVIDGISGSVDNIESFKRLMQEEVYNAEKYNATSISIPSISFVFEINSYNISLEAQELLLEFEKYYLKTNKEAIIEIEGYTCNLGTDDFNNILSKNRAETVKEFFIKNNIPINHIETKWYGRSKNNALNYPTQEDYRRVIVAIKS